VTGVGTYADVAKGAVAMDFYGRTVRVASLDVLERAKRAVGTCSTSRRSPRIRRARR
jgi:hypothetical protein